MPDITPIPINYDELRHTGRTETCDLDGEVIELAYIEYNGTTRRKYRVTALRGSDWYGEHEMFVGDDLALKMCCYYAIKNLHKIYVCTKNV